MNKRIVKVAGTLLTWFSVVAVIIKLFASCKNISFDFNLNSCISVFLSLVIYTLVFRSFSFAWKLFLEHITNQKIEFSKAYYIYNKANLGKYLPGNVMHYIERNVFMSQNGAGQIDIALCSVLEILGTVFSALAFSALFSWSNLISFVGEQVEKFEFLIVVTFIVVAMGICFFLVLCYKFEKLRVIVKRVVNKKNVPVFVLCLSIYLLAFFAHGITLVLCMKMFPIDMQIADMRELLSANAMSWLIGFLIPGAPGGIGVREFVLSTFTRNSSYSDYVLAAAVIHRFILVAVDLISCFIGFVIQSK